MYDMLNLQQFRALLAIRDSGSMNRAARTLDCGVPTIDYHLRGLERHLRVRLVERDRAGARLTPLGESFAVEAEAALTRIERAERMIADQRDAGVSTLRIGTFASLGSRLLPWAISRLQQRTSVRVEVVEAEPTEIVRLLRGDEVHAGLIYDISEVPAFAAPDLVLDTLLTEPYGVMVARRGEWAERETLDFSELAGMPWVCSRNVDEASDRVLRRVCASLGYEPRELMRTDDLYMIHGLVEQGLGLALATPGAVDNDFEVVFRPAKQRLGERRVSYAVHEGDAPAAAVWLGEMLRSVA